MPPWLIDIESATEIEAKSNGTPPAPRMAAQASRANPPSSALHGVTRPSVEATPTNGLPRSASDRPSARRNARWGARSSPSTVMREGSFGILTFRSYSKRQRQGGKMLRAALALLLLSVNATAWPQAYPARAVRIVVPFATGGPADIYARFIGAKLQDALGQPFVIEDRPGGGSIVGTDVVAKSPPDGYTLLMMSNTHTVNETLIPKKPFDLMRDLAPVSGVNYSDLLMVIHPSVPANSLKEFIELAKSSPGTLNYASSGPGTPYHMAGELFKAMAGVDIVHVPHKGSDQARTAILGKQVDMMFDAITTMAPNARAGRVKALASSGRTRSPVTPDVPTLAEGGVPGYEATIWLGLMAPAGTPRPVLERLNAELIKVVNAPEVKQNWGKQAAVPMGMTPEQFDRFLREDIVKWAKVVKLSGAKVD